jgi:hypothetical protein
VNLGEHLIAKSLIEPMVHVIHCSWRMTRYPELGRPDRPGIKVALPANYNCVFRLSLFPRLS